MRTIIIGLGNPLLTDDALGIRAATILRQKLIKFDHIEVIEAYLGGLGLMELMVGFDRAIVVDSMTTGVNTPGTLVELTLDDLIDTRNTTNTHDTSLAVALETGRMLNLKLPAELYFFGIEVAVARDFGLELTEPVRKTLPALINQVMITLGEEVTR